MPAVLWHCWLGVRKSIRPLKLEWWGVGVVICLPGARCRLFAYGPADATAAASSLASFKSRLVLPFWYQLTIVVLEKKLLNGCSSSYQLHCAGKQILTKYNVSINFFKFIWRDKRCSVLKDHGQTDCSTGASKLFSRNMTHIEMYNIFHSYESMWFVSLKYNDACGYRTHA